MIYDSYDDYFYFILGAMMASGSSFWTNKSGTNKYILNENGGSGQISISQRGIGSVSNY